jgi:pimeloyl-ACP methyl ester carboxylesterase
VLTSERDVAIPVEDGAEIKGTLRVPDAACGLVIFAHGSGSGRHSPRNRFVAEVLERGRIATLLIDLLTEPEELLDRETAALRFDIPLLAQRLLAATDAAAGWDEIAGRPFGYFGASTGAAAALVAAARIPERIAAIVSRGGRPDLAGDALPAVRAPTLLLVGGADPIVLRLNQEAVRRMRAPVVLKIIPGATHLFEEPGTLEEVAVHARDWFRRYFG